ncbi:Hypothetical predicted protein [Pelobates cultripes]|uniref:Uncharacterized protein n=1 Tax=Pelobates cultripes TaxID=61616 RepID=A0AAD1RB82_PELCU|nr:Hypothetical predicted protein [Pelobates cultripes]
MHRRPRPTDTLLPSPRDWRGYPGPTLRGYAYAKTPQRETRERRGETLPCRMAAAVCARHAELHDYMAMLDNLFAKFWKKMAAREQLPEAYKPAKCSPMALPIRSQCRRIFPSAGRARKWHLKRRGSLRARRRGSADTNTLQYPAHKHGMQGDPPTPTSSSAMGPGIAEEIQEAPFEPHPPTPRGHKPPLGTYHWAHS